MSGAYLGFAGMIMTIVGKSAVSCLVVLTLTNSTVVLLQCYLELPRQKKDNNWHVRGNLNPSSPTSPMNRIYVISLLFYRNTQVLGLVLLRGYVQSPNAE